jgi:hypothetical protein
MLNIEDLLVVRGEYNTKRSALSLFHLKWITLSVVVISAISSGLRVGLNRNIFVVIQLLWMILIYIRSLFRIITISHSLLAMIEDASCAQGLSQETQDKHADIRLRLRRMRLGGLAVLPLIPLLVSIVISNVIGGWERKTIVYDGSFMATRLSSWPRVVYDVTHCVYILVSTHVLWIPAGVRNQVIVTHSLSGHVGDILPEPSAPMVQETHGEESSGPLRAPLEITMLNFNGTPGTSVMMPLRSSSEKSGTPTLTFNVPPPRGTVMGPLRAPVEMGTHVLAVNTLPRSVMRPPSEEMQ